MKFSEYQEVADQTALYDGGIVYTTLGLTGEAGEFADKLKKVIRDNDSVFTEEVAESMLQELGDVLWYVAQCARELGTDLEEVAQMNNEKLLSRLDRGVLGGSGDDR